MRDGISYVETLEQFLKDVDTPYDLPPQYVGSYYEPGVNHYLDRKEALKKFDPSNRVYLDPNWAKGDLFLSKVEELVAKKAARDEASKAQLAKMRESFTSAEVENPMSKYTNFLQALQSSGLMDKLSQSSNMIHLTYLVVNTTVLFDDPRIESSLNLLINGLEGGLAASDLKLLNSLLKKHGFDFTIKAP
jgi:hypothetical protein